MPPFHCLWHLRTIVVFFPLVEVKLNILIGSEAAIPPLIQHGKINE